MHPWLQLPGSEHGHSQTTSRDITSSCPKAEEKSDKKKCRRQDVLCKGDKTNSDEIGTEAMKLLKITPGFDKDSNLGEEKSSNLARHIGNKQMGGCKGEY